MARSSGKLKTRHIVFNGKRTSVALEQEFWKAADQIAVINGMTWLEWVLMHLNAKPGNSGRAGWLRVMILETSLTGSSASG